MNGLEATAAKIRARYRPADRKPFHDWENLTLSVSKLVPNSATAYAGALIAHRDEVEEDSVFNPKWGFLGNTVCDAAFADLAAHENELRVPLCDEVCPECEMGIGLVCPHRWSMLGHFDGADLHPDGVVIAEGKFYLYNTAPSKTRDAMRQGKCYLAMGWWLRCRTPADQPLSLGIAAYDRCNLVAMWGGVGDTAALRHMRCDTHLEDFPVGGKCPSARRTFNWPAGVPPLGVVVACHPSHIDEERVEHHPMSIEDCEQVLAFYAKKAIVIRDSYRKGDLAPALAFEAEYPAEDIRELRDVMAKAPLPAVDTIVSELAQVKAKLTPKLDIDEREEEAAEERQKELRTLLLSAMTAAGERKLTAHGLSIRIDISDAKLKPAEPARLVPAKVKLVVSIAKAPKVNA